jgi:hypothetical protein
VAAQDCLVFLPGNHAAYIDQEQFERNQGRLASQRRRGPQPTPRRQIISLLAGRVFCGHCGARMQTHYSRQLRYECARRSLDYGESRCESLPGLEIEQLLTQQILVALEPASVELSLTAAENIEAERADVERDWRLRLQRAKQDVDRAFRQYNAVEPENRLVARTLESRWEAKLNEERTLTESYDRFRASRPANLSASERQSIQQLSTSMPRLWNTATVSDKRRVVELLLEKAVIRSDGDDRVSVTLHWSGGMATHHNLTRRVHRWRDMSNYNTILQLITEAEAAGSTSDEIATSLNTAGYRTCHGSSFNSANVRQLRKRAALSADS